MGFCVFNQAAIAALQSSPQFAAMMQQGEGAMLQNASATGGLRGGNLQGALAQFRPQLLSQLIEQQFSRLGGMAQAGQSAAAGQANAGMQTGTNVANLYGDIGQAQAGGALAKGQMYQNMLNAPMQGLGMYAGMGGF